MPVESPQPLLATFSTVSPTRPIWSNQVGGVIRITNPGYYVPIKQFQSYDNLYYNYDYDQPREPTYQQVTGLRKPHQPEARTAEEWLLINNSDTFHPFHIHINPFYVMEVGQLTTDGNSWKMARLSDSASPYKWYLNNWRDTIAIPPHGYVRMRMWLNVPLQRPQDSADPNSPLEVVDNANVYGSWVYHCHILRHEDRGMMMMINVKPSTIPMPSLMNMTVKDAMTAVKEKRLNAWFFGPDYENVFKLPPAYEDGYIPPHGIVTGQTPKAGTPVPPGTNEAEGPLFGIMLDWSVPNK